MQTLTYIRSPSDRTSQVDEDGWTDFGMHRATTDNFDWGEFWKLGPILGPIFTNKYNLTGTFNKVILNGIFLKVPVTEVLGGDHQSLKERKWLCTDHQNKTQACCKTFLEHWITWEFIFGVGSGCSWQQPDTRWASRQNLGYASLPGEQNWLYATKEEHLQAAEGAHL